MAIKKVWIEEGCISCNLCADIVPDVFDVPEGEDCVVKPDAQNFFTTKSEEIVLAAEDCPVEVIQVDSED